MKFIALIKTEEIRKTKQIADLFTRFNENNTSVTSVYILDKKGVEKNHPDLSIHQYAHRWFTTIVDAGCQHIGDVVDVLLTGAYIVVIRPDIWKEADFASIRDISESKIYVWFDASRPDTFDSSNFLLYKQADGIILFLDQLKSPLPFTIRDTIQKAIAMYSSENIMLYDSMNAYDRYLNSYSLKNKIVNPELIN